LEIIEKFLESQQDPSCKHNVFCMPFRMLGIVLSNIFFFPGIK